MLLHEFVRNLGVFIRFISLLLLVNIIEVTRTEASEWDCGVTYNFKQPLRLGLERNDDPVF